MAQCLISLGSNLGDRAALLDAAVARLALQKQVRGFTESRRFETAPIGGPVGQNYFLNSAARCETTLSPADFLLVMQAVEKELGRLRKERWGARVVDLDLLLYDELILTTPSLQLPHPRMAFRRFVLEPAVEVAPEMIHPTTGWTVERLWKHLHSAPDVIVVTGGDLALCEEVCRAVVEQLGGTGKGATQIVVKARGSVGSPKLVVDLLRADEQSLLEFNGPVLNLSAEDLSRAIQEIGAAVLAMR